MLCASCSAQALCACSVQALCACALCKLLCASALSKLLCASALRQLLRASALRMCSVQVGLCKLLCASALCNCSVQVALRKLLCASDSAQVALRKCCRSCGNVLRVLRLYLKVAIFQPELREHAPHTTSVLKVAIFQPELQEYGPRATLRFSSRSCGGVLRVLYLYLKKLRFSSLSSGSTLRILRLYLKVAIFQPEVQEHAPRTTFVLKSCDFQAGAAVDQGESNPRPRDCESRRANHETTSKGRFASKKIARRHSESASTRTISAEGSPRLRHIRTAPQRERFDAHDLRRGSRAHRRNR